MRRHRRRQQQTQHQQLARNSFFTEDYILDPAEVEADPSKYLDYKPEEVSGSEQRLRDIESAITELGEIIGG